MDGIPYVDGLVCEYLLFRGYAKTYRAFNAERQQDRLKYPQVDAIVHELFDHIDRLDLDSLLELWRNLDAMFFSRLSSEFATTVRKLETSLRRCFIVHCIKHGKINKVMEFFERFAHDTNITQDPDWQPWFALPYVKDPSEHETFECYFSKQWLDMFAVSLKNFLSTIFQEIAIPKILAFNIERLERKGLQNEVESLRADTERLRTQLVLLETELRAYKAKTYTVYQRANSKKAGDNTPTSSRSRSSSPGPTGPTLFPASPQISSTASSSSSSSDTVGSASSSSSSALSTASSSSSSSSASSSSSFFAGSAGIKKDSDKSTSFESKSLGVGGGVPGTLSLRAEDQPFLITSQEVFSGHSGAVTMCRFSGDGKSVASGSKDGTVRIWTLDAGAQTANGAETESGAGSSSSSSGSSGGGTGGGASQRNASIYNTAEICSLQWDPKGDKLLLFGTGDSKVKIWNVDSKRTVAEMDTAKEYPRILDIASSPTDALFVTAAASGYHDSMDGGRGMLASWNLKTGKMAQQFRLEPAPTQINTIVFNHNGNMLVTGGADGMIRIFDMITCTPIMGWPAHEGQVCSVRFSSDETNVMSCGTDGEIIEWSLHRVRKVLRKFDLYSTVGGQGMVAEWPVLRCEMALDGEQEHLLVSSTSYNSQTSGFIYNMTAPHPVQLLSGHSGPVLSVDWHPTLNMCLTGSVDHTVRVRKLARRRSMLDNKEP